MKRTEANLEEIQEYNLDVFNREIYLWDSSEKDCIDTVITAQFIKNFRFLDKNPDAITIHIQSIGGDWYCGMAMYDLISTAKSHVKIVCHGSVMSIATLVLQAGDERVAMPNCVFMFHEGQQSINGTYKQAQSSLVIDKRSRDDMITIYAEKCRNAPKFQGKSLSKVKGYIKSVFNSKEDWYLTAKEALENGFIDSIYVPRN